MYTTNGVREGMPKKKRSLMERAVEALIGGLVAYFAASATDVWRAIFLIGGMAIIFHALLKE